MRRRTLKQNTRRLKTTVVPACPLAGVNPAMDGIGGGNPPSTSMIAPPVHPKTPVYSLPLMA